MILKFINDLLVQIFGQKLIKKKGKMRNVDIVFVCCIFVNYEGKRLI